MPTTLARSKGVTMRRTSGKPFSVAAHAPVQMRLHAGRGAGEARIVDAGDFSRESARNAVDPVTVTVVALKLVMTAK